MSIQVDTRIIIDNDYWKLLKELNPIKAKKVLNYCFRVKFNETNIEENKINNIIMWCINNTVGLVRIDCNIIDSEYYIPNLSYINYAMFYVENKNDAMKFKMTWINNHKE